MSEAIRHRIKGHPHDLGGGLQIQRVLPSPQKSAVGPFVFVDYFGDGNLGLTGTLEEVRKLTGGLGIFFQKQSGDDDGADYSVDHSAAVLVIDPDGGFHAVFSGRHVVDNFVHDLPILMGNR